MLAADMYGSKLLDSTTDKNGNFSFKGKASETSFGTLIVEKNNKLFPDYYNLFIEPGTIKVRMSPGVSRADITGSKNNNILNEVEASNKKFWQIVPPLYDSINYASMKLSTFHKADEVNQDSIKYYQNLSSRMESAAAPYLEQRNKSLMAAFKKYPNSLFTAQYALHGMMLPDDSLKTMYAAFDEKIKESELGKQWYERLYTANKLEAGTEAPNFTTSTSTGEKLSLTDFRGKYVLLDFWATWCIPCRAGNPHLIELYKKYNSKGIEFIGIADDDKNIAGWKKAIKNDSIDIWHQVLRGRESNDLNKEPIDVSKLYMVDSYPTKILIDREGKIVGQWTGEDGLDEVLEKAFAK